MNPADRPRPSRQNSELLDLLWEFSESKISAVGAARLSELLAESEANRDAYQQFMQMVADLEWGQFGGISLGTELKELVQMSDRPGSTSGAQAVSLPALGGALKLALPAEAARGPGKLTSPREDRPPRLPGVFFRPPLVYATIGAAMLLSALSSTAWVYSKGSLFQADQDAFSNALAAQQKMLTAAYLTSATGCNWSGSGPRLQTLGDGVRIGEEIRLYGGVAEFRLESGVVLRIEGPASLVITSPSSIVMQHGKFSAQVPFGAGDFRALACGSRITANDAKFGAKVVGNRISVHVFSGNVVAASCSVEDTPLASPADEEGSDPYLAPEIESDLDRGSRFSQAMIIAGRAVELVSDGSELQVSKWLAADETQFSTRLPEAGVLPITEAYVDAVKKSSPAYYWRFEEWTKVQYIRDEVANSAGLKVQGYVNLVGDSTNRVIEFGQPGVEGFVYTRKSVLFPKHSDYSVEVWVKPYYVRNMGLISLVKERLSRSHEFFLELRGSVRGGKDLEPERTERIRFWHRNRPENSTTTGTSCYSAEKYQPHTWHHVVAVKEGKQLRLYVNGNESARAEDDSFLGTELYLNVGRRGGRLSSQERPFVGQLDELSIYSRALTAEEVQEHFKAVTWDTPQEEQQLADKEEV